MRKAAPDLLSDGFLTELEVTLVKQCIKDTTPISQVPLILEESLSPFLGSISASNLIKMFQRCLLVTILDLVNYNITDAARVLKLNRTTLLAMKTRLGLADTKMQFSDKPLPYANRTYIKN